MKKIIEVSGVYGCIDLPLTFTIIDDEYENSIEGPMFMRIQIRNKEGEIIRIEKQSSEKVKLQIAEKYLR